MDKCSRIHNPFRSLTRTMFFRILLLASAISIVSLLYSLPTMDFGSIAPKTYDHDCAVEFEDHSNLTVTPGSYLFHSRILNTFWGSFDSLNCKKEIKLVSSVVKNLMGQRLLWRNSEAESLCVGEYSDIAVSTMQKLGFCNITNHQFLSFNKKNLVYKLDHYRDYSFDFVLSNDFGKVPVPALLVLEVERVLKPNGTGALILDFDSYGVYSNNSDDINMIRIASPISSLLRFSTIVYAGVVNNHGLVVFQKNSESKIESENKSSSFYHDDLPEDCKSVKFTKPLINLMEPLVKEKPYEKNITYLPKFKDVSSSKKNLVYVNIGGGYDWFPESYPIDKEDFNVYFLHYNFSIMLSHVKGPRVTFVYHPELNENFKANNVTDAEDMNHYLGEDKEFDLVAWFKETVEDADFVVLMMNASKVEMKFLKDIYENGVICFVDELFLNCSESGDGDSCMDIYNGLRSNGVFVHQWWNNELHQGSHL
ncbi:peptide upstream protein [Trifolium repens]|nr:peptide upstream protein [Trifolium repens]